MAMKTTPVSVLFRKHLTPRQMAEGRKWADEKSAKIQLRALRKSLGITQKQLADTLKVSQPVVSAMESRSDYQVATLRRVIRALGGEMDIIARFPDRVVTLSVA